VAPAVCAHGAGDDGLNRGRGAQLVSVSFLVGILRLGAAPGRPSGLCTAAVALFAPLVVTSAVRLNVTCNWPSPSPVRRHVTDPGLSHVGSVTHCLKPIYLFDQISDPLRFNDGIVTTSLTHWRRATVPISLMHVSVPSHRFFCEKQRQQDCGSSLFPRQGGQLTFYTTVLRLRLSRDP